MLCDCSINIQKEKEDEEQNKVILILQLLLRVFKTLSYMITSIDEDFYTWQQQMQLNIKFLLLRWKMRKDVEVENFKLCHRFLAGGEVGKILTSHYSNY